MTTTSEQGYTAWTIDQLTTGMEALAEWALERAASGYAVDASTFDTIQRMATERAAR